MTLRKIIIEILVMAMTVLFLYAGITKLMNIHFFELQLKLSPWISNFNRILAWALPSFEIAIAVMLLIGGKFRTLALYCFGSSLLVFSIYISVVLISGRKAPCSCGGLIQKLSWTEHISLNLSFVVISIITLQLIIQEKASIQTSKSSYS
ncbi:MauE/DoxX family redox-associated membrane protein [Pedobacter sp.]